MVAKGDRPEDRRRRTWVAGAGKAPPPKKAGNFSFTPFRGCREARGLRGDTPQVGHK